LRLFLALCGEVRGLHGVGKDLEEPQVQRAGPALPAILGVLLAVQEPAAMIDWREVWRNPKPSELDVWLPFGFGRADDLPLAAYSVALGEGAPTSLVLTTIHFNDPLELFRYRECEKSWERYRPCATPQHLWDLRGRSLDPSDSSVTRRDLRRFVRPSNVSPVTARRLDAFVSGLSEMLQDPSSYHWERIGDGILEIYVDTSMRQAGPGEMDGVHEFARDLVGFLSCVFYVKWLIGLGSCDSDPDFDHLNYPRIDPEWKRMEDWETDIKWSVRALLRCEEQFAKDPDLRKALQEFKSRTGFKLRLIKRMLLGTESCQFEIPELSLSFGDFFGKGGGGSTPQDSALQSAYKDIVGPVEDRILDRLMKEQRLSEASPITFDPPLGSIHSLIEAMAWGPTCMLMLIESKSHEEPNVEQIPNYDEAVGALRRDLEDLAGDTPRVRERASRYMETIWVDQYGALGLRQDLQSELIERLEILDNSARAMTTQPRRLQSAYYKLFFELETKLRDFIRTVLEKEFGDDWWQSAVPEPVRCKCEKEADKEKEFHGESSFHPIEYCYFVDLKKILEKRWSENFQKFFEDQPGDSRDEKLAWLGKLIPIRNVLMHPRRPLSIRESWAIEVGSRRVEALAKKLGVFGESHPSEQ